MSIGKLVAIEIKDAMYPKVAVDPKKVEADIGPVIGEVHFIHHNHTDCTDDLVSGKIYRSTDFDFSPTSYQTGDSKPTNPKDAVGSDKLPLHLVPSALNIYASLAFLEGALKYGCYNWRVAGVRMSIYLAALERHFQKFKDGEWADEKTGVPHLSSMLACIGIILDAKLVGKLTDDRPPVAPTADLIASLEAHVPRLKELFKDHHPHQHTIQDIKEPA